MRNSKLKAQLVLLHVFSSKALMKALTVHAYLPLSVSVAIALSRFSSLYVRLALCFDPCRCRTMTAVCFVCNLPIMSHQVGLVWQGGNGWDDLVREQVSAPHPMQKVFGLVNRIFLILLAGRVHDPSTSWRTSRLGRTDYDATKHLTAAGTAASTTQLTGPTH